MVNLTAEDWQLYTATLGRKTYPIAQKLNNNLNKFIRQSENWDTPLLEKAITIREKMYKVMYEYKEFGACDTEPETVLVCTIEKELGLPENSLSR